MSRHVEIARLQGLANMVLDHRLTALQAIGRARAETESALLALAAAPDGAEGLEGAAGALASLAYQRWADARRGELVTILARQTQDWLAARAAAQQAFGKDEALKGVAVRLSPPTGR